jgi:23S rRNA pseudouridine2605 synthase
VRRVLAHLDLPVMRLIRVAFGPFYLGELDRNEVEEVPQQALANLLGVKPPPRKAGWARPKSQRRRH